ncbi:Chloroperoxidase [Aspergillus granulosus]|uniref:Chloroperoxidase n=1 Tax=Aspergillus granulosus TaxID=176169 RepID=A0ABR4H923_9EURO
MRLSLSTIVALAGLAAANIHIGTRLNHHGFHDFFDPTNWKAAESGDARSPCPMLNTLANHNYIPHDGRNITRPILVDALTKALNFNPDLASGQFDNGLLGNPEPNADYFDLDMLNQHNTLEHDASLSRQDAYFGPADTFNRAVFDQSRAYWTEPTLTAAMLSNSKVARMLDSKAHNPTYTFTAQQDQINLGEVGGLIAVFGSIEEGTVSRDFVEYFFEHERLPTSLGWQMRSKELTADDMAKVSGMIAKGTTLITEAATDSSTAQRRRAY